MGMVTLAVLVLRVLGSWTLYEAPVTPVMVARMKPWGMVPVGAVTVAATLTVPPGATVLGVRATADSVALEEVMVTVTELLELAA